MTKIIVITRQEKNVRTGVVETLVSHGVDAETLETIVFPQVHPVMLGARFDPEYGEFTLER